VTIDEELYVYADLNIHKIDMCCNIALHKCTIFMLSDTNLKTKNKEKETNNLIKIWANNLNM
jgi:hypothetical protein